MKCLTLSFALLAAGLPVAALASGGEGFVRAELGRSDVDLDDAYQGEKFSNSDDDTAYAVRGGYWFTANFGVEGVYNRLYDKSTDGTSTELGGYGVGVVTKKNFGPDDNGFFISGRLGVMRTKVELGGDSDIRFSDSSSKAYYGVGVGYDFDDRFGLSLTYDRQKADVRSPALDYQASFDAKVLALGAELRF